MKSVAPILAIRQNCISPGRICTTGFSLAIDRDDFGVVVGLRMLDEQELLRQVPHDREEILEAVHDEPTRHAAQHLFSDYTMRVWVIPEQAGALTTCGGNAYLVVELVTWMDMDEHVIAVSLRRYSHSMVVQVRRIIGEVVF
jgi:hypothetical protein